MVPGQDAELAQQRIAGEGFDEEQFLVDTHASLTFILAPIAVRHDDQRMSFFLPLYARCPSLAGGRSSPRGDCELAQ